MDGDDRQALDQEIGQGHQAFHIFFFGNGVAKGVDIDEYAYRY